MNSGPLDGQAAASPATFVTQSFDYDGGRLVSVYVPGGPVEAVVFAGDGAMTSRWGRDLDREERPATMLVGIHRHADESARLREYSPGFDPERFARHEQFLVGEVRSWVEQRFGVAPPPTRTAIYGASAGAELALALGLRHPDVFGAILGASPGAGFRPPAMLPSRLPRTYLVAGEQEPFFLNNAKRWEVALSDAGAEVVLVRRSGSHGDPFWRAEFPRMIDWAFAQKR